ncbi:Mur ligase family protein [Verrucomicrobiota bacterium]
MSSTDTRNISAEVLRDSIKGSFVAVMGIGRKGIAAARLVARFGGIPFLSDKADVSTLEPYLTEVKRHDWKWEAGGHSERVLESNLIVRCSAVPASLPLLGEAKVPVLDELDFASAFVEVPLVAVTGTNGKTLTIAAFSDIAREAGYKVIKVGGTAPFLSEVLTDDKIELDGQTIVVAEVSAVQLDSEIRILKPDISCITQVAPDHEDRFQSFEDYANAKAGLFRNQESDDLFVANYDCPICRSIAEGANARKLWVSLNDVISNGIIVKDEAMYSCDKGALHLLLPLAELSVPTHHLGAMLLAAGIAAGYIGRRDRKVPERIFRRR